MTGSPVGRALSCSPTESIGGSSSASFSRQSPTFSSKEEQWATLIPPGTGGGAKLRRACKEGDYKTTKNLIARGASVHSFDEAFERTPLHFAAMHGHIACAALLIEHGAAADPVDVSNLMPIHLAAEHGKAAMCQWLARTAGANVVARTPNGCTPLQYAVSNNHSQCALALLELMKEQKHLKIDNHPNRAALTSEALMRLIERGGPSPFDPFRDNYGNTAPELARAKGHTKLAEQLELAVSPTQYLRNP